MLINVVLTITVVTLHFGGSQVGVWTALVPIVWAAVILFPEIRTIVGLVIWILPLTFVVAYLMYSLSCRFRNQVISWLMVGLSMCISLGEPIDAPVNILLGSPWFLFLSESPPDVAIPEYSDES